MTTTNSILKRSLLCRYRIPRYPCCYSFSTDSAHQLEYLSRRAEFRKEIEALPEYHAAERLAHFLDLKEQGIPNDRWSIRPPIPPPSGYKHEMNGQQIVDTIDAVLATFCLHVESRIAAVIGKGFYTIGPCGEEALSSAAHCLKPEDSLALHYRHLGINLCRQIAAGGASIEQLILDRARGYTVSKEDPVTGGVHCSIGSEPATKPGSGDFIVTSTLASQCPPAVGRALGYSLRPHNETDRPVSMVTVGDGSVHNHHFWSAFHLARHARHRHIKCPVVFGISDNGLSISYNPEGYVDTLFDHDPVVPLFRVNGNDMLDVYSQTKSAVDYARRQSAPAVILYKNLVRRFGHAATDRQRAYLEEDQIQSMADTDIVERIIVQAVEVMASMTYSQVRDRLAEIKDVTLAAFAKASEEDKVDRGDMLGRVSAPQVSVPSLPNVLVSSSQVPGAKREVMRKHMTSVIAESLEDDDSVVYLGEDVIHGGYYVVTEGLAQRFPGRVLDFPPDETSLLGAALGFSQVGLLPIVEIPYAKYLDCGADMFNEIAILYWLSNGKRPNGMVIRLQGFDRGLFGGSFHTSNLLHCIPPGVDVCCYSNGEDYVLGYRNAIRQAKAGRVVMSVDCTNLLNLRHLHGKDRAWERSYPAKQECGLISFDTVRRYGTEGSLAIITYGNGVVTALQARKALVEDGALPSENVLDILDCPYLSGVPDGLRAIISQYDAIVLADICKEGPGGSVLSSMVCTLKKEGLLPSKWELAAAPRTYNPLGSMTTFLNTDDIIRAFHRLTRGEHDRS